MRQWWFITRALNAVFKMIETEDFDDFEDEQEMYICAVCESMFMDKQSYIRHYKVDTCLVIKDPLPSDPLELRMDK